MTAPVSASGGSAGASITGVDLKTGDASAGVTVDFKPTDTTQMTFEASKIPLQSAGIPSATPGQAQLFISNGATNPPTIAGVAISRFGQLNCKQTYTRTSSGSAPKTTTGGSGDTTVRAVLNPDYNNKRFATDDTAPEVSFGLPRSKADVVCVGTIMVQAKSADVDINVVDLDAAQYALGLAGYKKIYLLSPESAIGGALGVDSEGTGFGIGTSGVGLAGAVTAALGLSGGKNRSVVTPTGRIGTTYLILAEPNAQGASATMSTRDFDAYHARISGTVSLPAVNNGKMDAATKK
ncbi:MAG: hypothetical protein WAT84_02465 [Candidatus Moraniibacteriota bacterium]